MARRTQEGVRAASCPSARNLRTVREREERHGRGDAPYCQLHSGTLEVKRSDENDCFNCQFIISLCVLFHDASAGAFGRAMEFDSTLSPTHCHLGCSYESDPGGLL